MVIPRGIHEYLPHSIWGLIVVSLWHDLSSGNINSNRWTGHRKLGEFLPRGKWSPDRLPLFYAQQQLP
jgi:hypothetical protein